MDRFALVEMLLLLPTAVHWEQALHGYGMKVVADPVHQSVQVRQLPLRLPPMARMYIMYVQKALAEILPV